MPRRRSPRSVARSAAVPPLDRPGEAVLELRAQRRAVRSQVRPLTNGPRSTTGDRDASTVLGVAERDQRAARAASGARRRRGALVSVWPHAVPLPYRPGPYHEMLRSWRQGLRVDGDRPCRSGWAVRDRAWGGSFAGRARTASSLDPGSRRTGPPDRGASDRHRRPADGSRDLHAWKRSVSGRSSGLGTREPTGPGTATVASDGDERHARDDPEVSHVCDNRTIDRPDRRRSYTVSGQLRTRGRLAPDAHPDLPARRRRSTSSRTLAPLARGAGDPTHPARRADGPGGRPGRPTGRRRGPRPAPATT